MRARHDHRVRPEQLDALGDQVVVGQVVDLDALLLQPVDLVEVGREARRRAERPVAELRAHVEDRAQHRAVADARTVLVDVVRAVQRVLGDVAIGIAGQRRVGVRLGGGVARVGALAPGVAPDVGEVRVRHVGHGRHQHGDPRPGRPARRTDGERQVVLVVAGLEPGGVDAARQVGRDRQLEVGLPAGVLEIVAMEVDGAVLAGSLAPIGLVAREVVAGDGAGRHVRRRAVAVVAGDVGDAVGRHVEAEVPCADEVGAERRRARPVTSARAVSASSSRARPISRGRSSRPSKCRVAPAAVGRCGEHQRRRRRPAIGPPPGASRCVTSSCPAPGSRQGMWLTDARPASTVSATKHQPQRGSAIPVAIRA